MQHCRAACRLLSGNSLAVWGIPNVYAGLLEGVDRFEAAVLFEHPGIETGIDLRAVIKAMSPT
jgi:hypothetical protein